MYSCFTKRFSSKLACVVNLFKGRDNLVRTVDIKTDTGIGAER